MYLDTTWQSLYFLHSKYYFMILNLYDYDDLYIWYIFVVVDFGARCDLCFHEILPFTAILLGFIKTS